MESVIFVGKEEEKIKKYRKDIIYYVYLLFTNS